MEDKKSKLDLKIENTLQNYSELVPFINKIFKEKFQLIQPKVYNHNEYLPCHFVVKHQQKIVGSVLSYPVDYHCNGKILKASGIGNVAVDKKMRGQSLMSKIMTEAVAQARANGVDYMFLGGNRKRYERFGFVPCNTAITFEVIKENVEHTHNYKTVTFEKITEDSKYLKQLEDLYNMQPSRYGRKYFYEVLTMWNNKRIYAILNNNKVIGHIIAKHMTINELNIISEDVTAQDVVISFFKSINKVPFMKVRVYPNRRDIIDSLSGLCQYHAADTCGMLNILNYKHCIDVLLNMYKQVCDWSMVLEIEGNCKLEIISKGGSVTVKDTDKPADKVLPKHLATIILTNANLANMHGLPFSLPLYITNPDEV